MSPLPLDHLFTVSRMMRQARGLGERRKEGNGGRREEKKRNKRKKEKGKRHKPGLAILDALSVVIEHNVILDNVHFVEVGAEFPQLGEGSLENIFVLERKSRSGGRRQHGGGERGGLRW